MADVTQFNSYVYTSDTVTIKWENLDVKYKMGDTVLGTLYYHKRKYLGITISGDMKVSEQCGIAASKGNQILGLIRRNITYKEKQLIIPLYNAIARPHLE